MPRKSTKIPRFKSEADEAAWYTTPEGRRQTQREFTRALRTGKLSRSPGLKAAKTDPALLEHLMEQAKENAQGRSRRKPASAIKQFSNKRFTRGFVEPGDRSAVSDYHAKGAKSAKSRRRFS
jgi:hypothetical protein